MKFIYIFIFIVLLPVMCERAFSDTFLTTSLASYHADREAGYNESNLGLGIRHDQYVAGFYENSHDVMSYYLGREFRYKNFGLQVGFVSGYKKFQIETPSVNGSRLYALPFATFGKDVQYKFGLLPGDDWLITFQIDIGFDLLSE